MTLKAFRPRAHSFQGDISMAGGYTRVRRRALAAVGAAALLASGSVLSACSNTAAPAAQRVPSSGASSTSRPTLDPAAAKAAADKAAAAVKTAGATYAATQARGEAAAAKAHPVAKAAAACGIPLVDIVISSHGSRIGMPDVPKRGDVWRVKTTSPVSPGMIIYWPDGGSVLCR